MLLVVITIAVLLFLGLHFGAPELPPRLSLDEQQYPAMVRLSVARQRQSQQLGQAIDNLLSAASHEDTKQHTIAPNNLEPTALDLDDELTEPWLILPRKITSIKPTVRYPLDWQDEGSSSPLQTKGPRQQTVTFTGRRTASAKSRPPRLKG